MVSVLVGSDRHAKYHKLDGLNNSLLSHSFRGWEVQDKMSVNLVPDESALLRMQMANFSLSSYSLSSVHALGDRGREKYTCSTSSKAIISHPYDII